MLDVVGEVEVFVVVGHVVLHVDQGEVQVVFVGCC